MADGLMALARSVFNASSTGESRNRTIGVVSMPLVAALEQAQFVANGDCTLDINLRKKLLRERNKNG